MSSAFFSFLTMARAVTRKPGSGLTSISIAIFGKHTIKLDFPIAGSREYLLDRTASRRRQPLSHRGMDDPPNGRLYIIGTIAENPGIGSSSPHALESRKAQRATLVLLRPRSSAYPDGALLRGGRHNPAGENRRRLQKAGIASQ